MHGMGDAANHAGMQQLAKTLEIHLNHTTPIINIALPTQDSHTITDSLASFFLNMHQQVEDFHRVIHTHPLLSQGFHAIGLSQGNLLLRAYIQRYNNPPIFKWISLHGPLLGVAGIPKCSMERQICDKIDALLDLGVYTEVVQQHLAQANYYRDPMHLGVYRRGNIFLPLLNHEEEEGEEEKSGNIHIHAHTRLRNGRDKRQEEERYARYNTTTTFPPTTTNTHTHTHTPTPTYPLPLSSTLQALVLVKAEQDTEIYPNESEWFGFFADGSLTDIHTYTHTQFYQKDSFGLRTLDEEGRLFFESTPGDHLQFEDVELLALVDRFFVGGDTYIDPQTQTQTQR
jgi:palmitoyl-protein thioesterase